jgi:hypothetical protein
VNFPARSDLILRGGQRYGAVQSVEAMVHEMAQQKLPMLGVAFESAGSVVERPGETLCQPLGEPSDREALSCWPEAST